MLAELGLITTGLALVCAVFACIAGAIAAVRNRPALTLTARNAAILTFPLISAAVVAMVAALVSGDFSIRYVYNVSNTTEPLFYKATALWGGQPGSLMFWAWMMSAFTTAALLINWRAERRLMPYVVPFCMGVLSFFMILVVLYENPFARFWQDSASGEIIAAVFQPVGAVLFTAADGKGLNPLLRHPGMVIHPPMLYAGYVGMVIPWAFGMAALASGQLNVNWIRATRRWTLVAWLFLSLGLILGGRWAYDVLGWGGYWGWDPVENSALLPWLTGTAFLHSVMIQEKRGMLKVWNLFLVILTFLLVILGTFATRSGIVASVHSFARSEIATPMLLFTAITVLGCLALWAYRWQRGELASDHKIDSLLSRESMFVLNNWIFIGIAVIVLWGTYAPVFSELFGTPITLGTQYYRDVAVPLFGLLYLLMGVAPLVAWKKSSLSALGRSVQLPILLTVGTIFLLVVTGMQSLGALISYGLIAFAGYTTLYEYYRGVRARIKRGESAGVALVNLFGRDRRRYGGYLVHLGVVVIGVGIVASTVFQLQRVETLNPGDSLTVGDLRMTYRNAFEADGDDGRLMVMANMDVFRGDQQLASIRPRIDYFGTGMNPMSIAGQYSTLESDLYVLLIKPEGERATFHVYLNPLVNLVWWGGLILMLGTFLAAFPAPERETVIRVAETHAPGRYQIAGD